MPTMTAHEIERFVEEVVRHAPALAEHTPLLKGSFEHLAANGFAVSTRFDIGASSVERTLGAAGGHVRLDPTVGADCLPSGISHTKSGTSPNRRRGWTRLRS